MSPTRQWHKIAHQTTYGHVVSSDDACRFQKSINSLIYFHERAIAGRESCTVQRTAHDCPGIVISLSVRRAAASLIGQHTQRQNTMESKKGRLC